MTNLKPRTLRPGLLVALKSSVRGNVRYQKVDIESEHAISETAREATWQTTRTIVDAAEHERAIKIRGQAVYAIKRQCIDSSFGLLCPEAQEAALAVAVEAARSLVEEFNANASVTRIALYVIVGRVAQDDVEAARAINAEMAELVGQMERGVQALSAETIREAASKAKALAAMLGEGNKARLDAAIAASRDAATAIVKAIKAGEAAALEVDKVALEKLAQARTAYLDFAPDAPAPEVKESTAPPVIDIYAVAPPPRAIDFAQYETETEN